MLAPALVLLAILSPGAPDGPLDSKSIAGNRTASVLLDRAPSLGISFAPVDPNAQEAPALSADRKALNQASPGVWLVSQIQVPDDTITEPPKALRDYLETHGEALWSIVTALERQPPEWVEPKDESVFQFSYLLPSIRLQRLLLAVALVEIRDGHPIDAGRALEASWSLSRPLEERTLLIHQLVSASSRKWQAGVLRKIREPSLSWLNRLEAEDPWSRMLEAFVADGKMKPRGDALSDPTPWAELTRLAPPAIAAGLSKVSPCEGARLEEEDVWNLAENDLGFAVSEQAASIRKAYREAFLPTVMSTFRRAARLSVDRELTLQILRLRLAKEDDPAKRWPDHLANPGSTACPGLTYLYRADAVGMEIRFEGSIVEPDATTVLPLTFTSRYPAKDAESTVTPTPAPPPPLTPTPEGGMIEPR